MLREKKGMGSRREKTKYLFSNWRYQGICVLVVFNLHIGYKNSLYLLNFNKNDVKQNVQLTYQYADLCGS